MSFRVRTEEKSAQAAVSVEKVKKQEAIVTPQSVRHDGVSDTVSATVKEIEIKLTKQINMILIDMNYLPPQPPPFVQMRVLAQYHSFLESGQPNASHEDFVRIIAERYSEFQNEHDFLMKLEKNVTSPSSIISRAKMFFGRIDDIIDRAQVSLFVPEAEATLVMRMMHFERFLADDKWLLNEERGMLAIHVDEENQQTIIQIGLAAPGPLYVTIPKILRPDEVAQNSIFELLSRLEPLCRTADPMAIIDGGHQSVNYNRLFEKRRVIRAPSGDTERLLANISITYAREKLTPENTIIINSAPHNMDEHLAVFKGQRGRGVSTWAPEAVEWDNTAIHHGFSLAAEASREAFVASLIQQKNVIVIMAHCDGRTMFMPAPPPEGTQITADYLKEHREEIAANKPFVYLFSCEAAKLIDAKDFASTLLECGAVGVVAAQTVLGAAEARSMLRQILSEDREAPPIKDVWRAMEETDYFEMEVFLA